MTKVGIYHIVVADENLHFDENIEKEKVKVMNQKKNTNHENNRIPAMITWGLGGKSNIIHLVNCATRLRCLLKDLSKIDRELLTESGASGFIDKDDGEIQIIYGPRVRLIKKELDAFLDSEEADLKKRPEFDEKSVTTKVEDALGAIYCAPVDGRLAPIAETPDAVFSQRMLGNGVVIFPTGQEVQAPCDAKVEVLFPTKHAIGLRDKNGIELMIHIGIDTVKLEGKGFTAHIVQGDTVKAGEALVGFDLDVIHTNAPSDAVPVVFTNIPATKRIKVLKTGPVKAGEPIIEIINA